jgi:glycine cleavage system H protein
MSLRSFSDSIPEDRLYCPQSDTWVIHDELGEVRIGATCFGVHRAGELVAFTARPEGAEIRRGKGMATVECHKTVLAVHAPISFRLIAGNAMAEKMPSLIDSSPYTDGWMVRGRPLDWETESVLLCDADAYRRHVLSIDPEARLGD